jgi:hypothetical protein
MDGNEETPDEIVALAIVLRRFEVPPQQRESGSFADLPPAEEDLTNALDEVARSAVESDWSPEKVAEVCLTWASVVAGDLLGQDRARALVSEALSDKKGELKH